jgi:hypothetical protein
VRIGYSHWGFLGPGITDTPDGGRAHRKVLIDGLIARGHETVFLQADRDRAEAELPMPEPYRFDDGFPEIDALFCEWRWPIAGRNTTPCGASGHTCDLHRQRDLLAHYTHARGTLSILWDKDRQMAADDLLRGQVNVFICEAALHPTPGATSLLFPVADEALKAVDPHALAALPRDISLVYVGNQYDRDAAFDRFFAPAAAGVPHVVAGKWPHTERWAHVTFTGRVPFTAVEPLHRRALATVLLLPDRYARIGQVTQRLFEAVLAGCLPLTPATLRSAHRFAPAPLRVLDGDEVGRRLDYLLAIAGTAAHAELISQCVRRLDAFRLSRQLDVIDRLLATRTRKELTPR